MKKIFFVALLVISVIFTGGGYPNNQATAKNNQIIDEKYHLSNYYYDNALPPLLIRYKSGSCTVEKIPGFSDKHGNKYGFIFDDGNNITKGSGKSGYFAAFQSQDGGDLFSLDTNSSKLKITKIKLGYAEPRLLVNGVVIARQGNRAFEALYPNGTKFDLKFDQGKFIDTGYGKYREHILINAEYSFSRKQYVLVYSESPFYLDNGEHQDDRTRCQVKVALFDEQGNLIKQFPLSNMYYSEGFFNSLTQYAVRFSDNPILFSKDEPNCLYIRGLIEKKNVRKEYDGILELIDTVSVKINLDNHFYKSVPEKEFDSHISKTIYPFIIDKRKDATYLLRKDNPSAKPLAVLKGDYVPIDCGENKDGSFSMIFASEKSRGY